MKLVLYKNRISVQFLILSIFILLSCSNDNDNNVEGSIFIPDVNFESILINQGIDSDGVINQQILQSDALKITTLDLSILKVNDINNLTGIEGFINLKKLNASLHNINEIDLSANIALEFLNLSGNQISNIDVSNNTNLIFLELISNNLTSITGLSNASILKDLDLSWNYFEELTITNESLVILHMSHNDLKFLNTDGLTNLKHVFVPSNKLEIVDFSTNTALETLLMAGNNLENINLENNSNLTHFYVAGNALKSLDVSNNEKLIDLRVDRNPELTCIKIQNNQNPFVMKSDYQELNLNCN